MRETMCSNQHPVSVSKDNLSNICKCDFVNLLAVSKSNFAHSNGGKKTCNKSVTNMSHIML